MCYFKFEKKIYINLENVGILKMSNRLSYVIILFYYKTPKKDVQGEKDIFLQDLTKLCETLQILCEILKKCIGAVSQLTRQSHIP